MIWAVALGRPLVLLRDAKPHRHLLNQLQLMPSVRPWLTKFFTIRGCNETGYQSSRFGGDAARRQGPPQFAARCAHHAFCARFFAGTRKFQRLSIASEILMHLQIMKRQPRAVATVHCHPPYSTGFAVAGVQPPTCMIPEYEVFSSVAIAPYRTPGTPEMGKLVADLVDKHNTILRANHGVVAWSHNNVEDAYFKMEILEAYCRTVLVATQLGRPVNTMTPAQLQDLLKIKQSLGIPDPRFGLKECELCDNDEWRPGVTCAVSNGAGSPAQSSVKADTEAEALVQAITDQIMSAQK